MKTIKPLLYILVLLLFCACENRPYPHTMQVADSLVNSLPDSAFVLLNRLKDSIAQEPEVTQMYYRLLTIKAEDKAHITHTSDSLIKPVLDYYEDKRDERHLPETYYYAGKVYTDLGDTPQALNYLQKAIKVAKKGTNYQLIGMAYNQTGVLYLYQRIYNKALDAFREALHYTILSKDNTSKVNNLRNIGRAFAGQNNIDSTTYYYKRAEQVAQETNDAHLVSSVNIEIASIYKQLGKYGKALSAIQSSHALSKFPMLYYTILGNLYDETGKVDSAEYYYTKVVSMDNCFDNKSGYYHEIRECYKGLSIIARRQGKLAKALDYMDQCLNYTDSLLKAANVESIKKDKALYNYQFQEKKSQRLENVAQGQKNWIITLSAGIILILAIILVVSVNYQLRKKQRKIQAERQQEKLKEITDKQYLNSLQFVTENEKRIEELNEKLQNAESQKSELEKNLQQAEKELLELTNRQIGIKQKIQTLSEAALKELQIYKDFYHVAEMPNFESISEKEKIDKKDWKELIVAINRTYNNFTERLKTFYPNISEQELRICILIKIAIPPIGIAKLTSHSKQAITSSRRKLYERTHNESATPDNWDKFILNF